MMYIDDPSTLRRKHAVNIDDESGTLHRKHTVDADVPSSLHRNHLLNIKSMR